MKNKCSHTEFNIKLKHKKKKKTLFGTNHFPSGGSNNCLVLCRRTLAIISTISFNKIHCRWSFCALLSQRCLIQM